VQRAFAQRPAVTLVPPPPGAPAAAQAAPSGAFEGRVISALTGKGLPGAQLTFARTEETASVVAGADGAFRFEPRAPGRWALAAATAPGHQPFAPEWGQSPVQLDARAGEVVRGITVALSPAEEYQGRVVDGSGQPVAGAAISILGGGLGTAALVPLDTRLVSDGSGAFRFSAPEEAVVEARREGFRTARARIDYSVRLSHKLTLRLEALGTAAALAIEGTVEDASGAGLEGASVSAERKDRFAQPAVLARTDAQGRFKLADLESGAWIVVASRPGLAPASAEVQAGTSGVRLRLVAGGRLAGQVTDKRTGAPVQSFTLLVRSKELQTLSVIDPGGRYQMEGLEPGVVTVSIVAQGHAPATDRRATIPESGTATLDFALGAGGRLNGVVVERGTRQPLAGAEVSVEGVGPASGVPIRNATLTGADGRFALENLEDAPLGITAAADGHHARILSVAHIGEGETAGPVTIELTKLAPGEEPRIELAGIGAVLEKRGEALWIGMVAPGGGAAEAGLGPGDGIVAIEGALVQPMTLQEAIQLLRGPEGTPVTVSVVKAGTAGTVTLSVMRRLVRG
jgi:hypothetical protein